MFSILDQISNGRRLDMVVFLDKVWRMRDAVGWVFNHFPCHSKTNASPPLQCFASVTGFVRPPQLRLAVSRGSSIISSRKQNHEYKRLSQSEKQNVFISLSNDSNSYCHPSDIPSYRASAMSAHITGCLKHYEPFKCNCVHRRGRCRCGD